MWNIVTTLTEIVGNKLPPHAVQGVNDFGKSKYSGRAMSAIPAYIGNNFRLYALDTNVALAPKSKLKSSNPQSKVTLSFRRL